MLGLGKQLHSPHRVHKAPLEVSLQLYTPTHKACFLFKIQNISVMIHSVFKPCIKKQHQEPAAASPFPLQSPHPEILMYVQAIPKYFQNMKELIMDQQYENLIMAIFPL